MEGVVWSRARQEYLGFKGGNQEVYEVNPRIMMSTDQVTLNVCKETIFMSPNKTR